MTRAELERLPAAALIDLILQQQETIVALQARLAAHEEQLRRPPKTPDNSSVPPSQGRKANTPARQPGAAKRGPRSGHPGRSRPPGEPTDWLELRVAACDGCGCDLTGEPQAPAERRQVVELPLIRPLIIEAVAHRVICPDCGQAHTAAFPAPFTAPQVFGARVQAAVAYLHEVHHVAYERLQRVLADLFTLPVAAGSLVNMVRRTGTALAGAAEVIVARLRQSPVIGSDETPMRLDGRGGWAWTFQTPELSVYVIAPSRGASVIRQTLGEAHPEVWNSDCFSAQLAAPAARFQICIPHQQRDLRFAVDCGDKTFAPAMRELFTAAVTLADARASLSPEIFARLHQHIEAACDALLAQDTPNAEGRKLQARYRRHRDKLFVFLERADVPPDNNGSERALRTTVVHRKVTGGFRSDWAPEAYSTIATVVETAKKQGHDIFATLLSAADRPLPATTGPPLASSLPA